jgi:hypothetical protein
MTNLAVRAYPEPLRTLAFGSISGTYAAIGTPLANPSHILIIQNLTNVTITFSFDGTTNHLILPSGGVILFDVTSDKTNQGGSFTFAEGTTIYASGTGATSGAVYVSTIFGING